MKEKNIQNTRFQYKARFKMLPFAGNYGGDRRFLKSEWLCKCGLSNESESHLLSGECHIYRNIRNKYENIDSEDNLIQFFSEVLEERERLEEEEEEEEEEATGEIPIPFQFCWSGMTATSSWESIVTPW